MTLKVSTWYKSKNEKVDDSWHLAVINKNFEWFLKTLKSLIIVTSLQGASLV